MKILVVSNLYPPHHIGGYDLGCQQIVDALRQQGHTVKVLTSTHGVNTPTVDGETYRWLDMEQFWLPQRKPNTPRGLIRKERINQGAFNRLCREFKPDAVYFWNVAHISISLAIIARQREIPAVLLHLGYMARTLGIRLLDDLVPKHPVQRPEESSEKTHFFCPASGWPQHDA